MEFRTSDGFTIKIDDMHSDLAGHNWRCRKQGHVYYAYATINKKRKALHRVIMSRLAGRELERGESVDHINRDGLDNTNENLRIANASQQMQNSKLFRTNKTGYKGVSYDRDLNMYRACISIDGCREDIGWYRTPEEASRAYWTEAKKHYGKFARLE